ncbi:MAG: NAD(+) synthase [Clostridia bacterium]|nr:NAD(+) synthase [Clostridia bacterium]
MNKLIKAALAANEISVANASENLKSITDMIKESAENGANIVVFPELSVTGYSCGDLFLNSKLTDVWADALNEIAQATFDSSVIAFIGLPIKIDGSLYDCVAVMNKGELLGFAPKRNLSYAEKRIFVSDNDPAIVFETDDALYGVAIGDDILDADYCRELKKAGATVIINPYASAMTATFETEKKAQVKYLTELLGLTVLSVGASPTESTTDYVCADYAVAIKNGEVIAERKALTDGGICYAEFKPTVSKGNNTEKPSASEKIEKNPFIPEGITDDYFENCLKIQSYGLMKRMTAAHAKTAVLGISGGLDSTLALLAAVRTFDLMGKDRKDIICVTMPCFGTTKRTKSNAIKMCEELGVDIREINIGKAVLQHFEDIGHDPSVTDVTYENSQARERTQILMDLSNRYNGLVIGTGDMSELALGWATYNGDHMSMYGLNASITKTLVRALVDYEARRLGGAIADILIDVIGTPVSPELLPADNDGKIAQKTEDLVGPYELHDFFLYHFIKEHRSPKEIYALACSVFENEYRPETVLKWLKAFIRRFFISQFKRSCIPDGPRVTNLSLSPRGSLSMPSDASFAFFMKELENL